jgi:hypothetical protein
VEMEQYRRRLAGSENESMTDDSMTADSWKPSRTAHAYAVREDFMFYTDILS